MRTFPGRAASASSARAETLTQLRVRGAEANHLLVMIDGVPANAVGDGEYNFADFAMDDIERIELLRGPQSGLYGANAHSGVLTIVTKSGKGLTSRNSARASRGGTQRSGEGAMSVRAARPARSTARLRPTTRRPTASTSPATAAGRGRSDGAQAHRDHRQGRRRLQRTFQCRRVHPPYSAQGRNRPAGPGLPEHGPRHRPARLRHQRDRRNAGPCRGNAQAVRRSLDPVGQMATSSRQIQLAYEREQLRPELVSASVSRSTPKTLSYKSALLLDSKLPRWGEASHDRPARTCARKFSYFDTASSVRRLTPSSGASGMSAQQSTGVGGEYVLDLLATGTTLSVRASGRTSTIRSRTNSPGASRCRRRSRRSAAARTRASDAA